MFTFANVTRYAGRMGTPVASGCQGLRHTALHSTTVGEPIDALHNILLGTVRHAMELVSHSIPAIAVAVLEDSKQENRFALLARLLHNTGHTNLSRARSSLEVLVNILLI